MIGLVKKYKAFKKDQEGTATIEFVLLFPAFIMLFLMGFESGYYMVRNVMLERAVDVAIRDVRLATSSVPQLDELKSNICSVATILPDCEASLQIEIRPIAPVPGGVAAAGNDVSCIDKEAEPNDPENDTIYDTGSGNQLMLVRVCALASPLFPTTSIGSGLRYDNFGNYAFVAVSAFVNEPDESTDRLPVPVVTVAANDDGDDGGNENGGQQGNNGFGNGDQDAPGNSGDNNGAENDQTPGGNGNSGGNGNNGNGNGAENDQTPGDNGNGNSGGNGNNGNGNGNNGNGNSGGNGNNGSFGDDDDDDDGGDD